MTKHLTVVPGLEEIPAGPDELWTIEVTAAFLHTTPGTLYQWRHRRKGPPVFKPGKRLLYDPAEVRAWLLTQKAA